MKLRKQMLPKARSVAQTPLQLIPGNWEIFQGRKSGEAVGDVFIFF